MGKRAAKLRKDKFQGVMAGWGSVCFLVDQWQFTTELLPSWGKIKDDVLNVS